MRHFFTALRAGPAFAAITFLFFVSSAYAHDHDHDRNPAAEIAAPFVHVDGHAIIAASVPSVAAQKTLGADIAQYYTEPARVVDAAVPHIMEQAVLACTRPELMGSNLYSDYDDYTAAMTTVAYDNGERGQPQEWSMVISTCTRPGETPTSDRDINVDTASTTAGPIINAQPRHILLC